MLSDQSDKYTTMELQTLPAANNSYVVGADIGGTNLRLALADSTGKILSRWSAPTSGIQDPQVVVDLISTGVNALFDASSIGRGSLRAIAAGAPGVTNVDAGMVIATSYLMGWSDVPLRSLLEAAIGVPVAVDNDVNLAAVGEKWTGIATHASDFVFLAIGTGIGAGIILDHKLFRGPEWTAGEVGYMLVPGVSEAPSGHGMPGALESIVGGEGIRAQWRSAWSAAVTNLPGDLMATRIFDYAVEGEPLAQSILHQSSQALAYCILNMALVLNCPLFVLGGGIGTHPALVDATRAILKQRSAQVSPLLLPSSLGADAQLVGAIRGALDLAHARMKIL